jgi:hypothetical protein
MCGIHGVPSLLIKQRGEGYDAHARFGNDLIADRRAPTFDRPLVQLLRAIDMLPTWKKPPPPYEVRHFGLDRLEADYLGVAPLRLMCHTKPSAIEIKQNIIRIR